jgi:hypothetical protein
MRSTAVAVLALSALLVAQAATPKTVDWKDSDGSVSQLTFASITSATTADEMKEWRAVDKVIYKYGLSSRDVEYEIGYHPVAKTGCGSKGTQTMLGGDMYACNKTTFSDEDLPMAVFGVERGTDDTPTVPAMVSDRVSFTSYIPVIGKKGVKLFSIVGNEGKSPFMDVVEYDYKTGKPTLKTRHSSMAGKGKLASAMGGTMTTWGTHLGLEATAADFSEGFPYEYRVKYSGDVEFAQREAMGRGRWTGMVCMADKKTCLGFVDDYLVMFVAKTAKDLSNGALYAAKISVEGKISWLKLTGDSATAQEDARAMYTKIADDLWEGSSDKIKTGKEDMAARLTTARAAAAMGATKVQNVVGMTYSFEAGTVYAAVSSLVSFAGEADRPCGAILSLKVGKYAVPKLDEDGAAMLDAKTDEAVMKVVTNEAVTLAALVDVTSSGSACSADLVRSPLTLAFAQYHNTLFIGEGHTDNAAVWAYDTKTSTLARVMTYPTGRKVSSLGWYQNLVGDARSFLFASAWSDTSSGDGQTGFLGPFFMPGYSSGSSDILPNTGLPLWDSTQPNALVSQYADNL